ncbi:tyrosine-type recombinase/integrase [Pantanalinema rosaneae CENA516]|uniref:tyrosine-type recombinase/integrase n=1 Tax=Pantanalinema rosaneae TaxID=1620701 RepID=UPI003D6FE35E
MASAVPISCDGIYQLVVKLLYGNSLRLIEGLRLRVKDVDFTQQQIVVRDGKGSKSRVTMLPSSVTAKLHSPENRVNLRLRNASRRSFF